MPLKDLYQWENMSLTQLQFVLIKMFGFDQFTMEMSARPSVASRVWIWLKVEKDGKTWYIDGQTGDIVKRRIIELLDKLETRPKEMIPKKEVE